MKSVMISIKPKWCEMIANGEKTVEIRKTRPKLETPFKCYIYCPLPNSKHRFVSGDMFYSDDELFRLPDGTIKHGDSDELMAYNFTENSFLSGRVIGEFVCDKIYDITPKIFEKNGEMIGYVFDGEFSCAGSFCMTFAELDDYLQSQSGYGWHISDLVIYDKPKELEEFYKKDFHEVLSNWEDLFSIGVPTGCVVKYPPEPKKEDYILTRPPQSWCYVEEN